MSRASATTSFARAAIGTVCSIAWMRLLAAMCIASMVACIPPERELSVGSDGGSPDGGETEAPPGEFCLGTGVMQVCLAKAPTMPREISSETVIYTDMQQMCIEPTHGSSLCVVAATTLSIQSTLRATGSRPLVLFARDSITIGPMGFVDVGSGSRPNSGPELGAGYDSQLCERLPELMADFTGGGGAGGSFVTAGASGGNGADDSGHGGSGGVPVDGKQISWTGGPLSWLRGGCAGQHGAGAPGGAGGHGGGAVWLIAKTEIHVEGAINAGGEGGKSGGVTTRGLMTAAGTTFANGGGGGGAGGMIALDAPAITAVGNPLIHADGGGGGEGGSSQVSYTEQPGNPGSDSYLTFEAAPGGSGNSSYGGDGGDGARGGLGMGDAKAGLTATGPSYPAEGGGGGGGGGGAGVIIVRGSPNLGTRVSPPAIAPPP